MKRNLTILAILMMGALVWIGCQQTAVTSAKVYIQQQNYEKAIEQAELAIKTNSKDPDAYFVAGEAYGYIGEYRKMNDAFNQSLKISSKNEQAITQQRNKYYVDLFNAGATAIKNNKLDVAKENYELCTELMPDRGAAYTNLALVYTLMKDDEKAIELYKKAIKLDPSDLNVQTTLGIIYYRDKMYDEAIEVFQEVIAKAEKGSENYNKAIYHTAYSYDMSGDKEKAIETYQSALESNPEDKDLLFNLGRLYFMQENLSDAIVMFKKVIDLDPGDAESYLNVGQAFIGEKHYEEAIPYYEKAVELKPESYVGWYNLAVCYIQTGQREKGEAAFAKAEKLKPETE